MRKGKKEIARKIVYGAFAILKEKTKKEPLEVFESALENVGPSLEVKPKRIGGATYQVPMEVKGERRIALAIRWIIGVARKSKGKPMKQKLAEEFINAAKQHGSCYKEKRRHAQDGRSQQGFCQVCVKLKFSFIRFNVFFVRLRARPRLQRPV